MASSIKLSDIKGDDWAAIAKEYKSVSTGPGTKATETLLSRANALLPFSRATGILDNGCGPGAIISALIATHGSEIPDSASLLAADFSAPMIEQVDAARKEGIEKGEKLWERVEAKVLDAMDLQGVGDASLSHVAAGWVYFMTPDPQKCLSESLRVLQPGGLLALSSWKGSQWMDIMAQVGVVRPDKALPGIPKEWTQADLLKGELEKAGFKDVQSEEVVVNMGFESRERFVEFLYSKQPHMVALTKDMSEEELQKLRELALAKCEEMCPREPGELHGTALLAFGRKEW